MFRSRLELYLSIALLLGQGITGPLLRACAEEDAKSTPGAVMQSIQQPGATNTEAEPSTQPQKQPSVSQEQPVPATASNQLTGKTLFVKKIRVEGVKRLDEASIRKLVADYEGKNLTFTELKELATKITSLYREKGYVTSRVYIPPQKIEDGVVTLQAAEGQTGNITLEGGKYFTARAIMSRIDMKENTPFDLDDLKQSLRRIQENPDVNLQVVLKAAQEPGKTDVLLKMQDRLPVHITPFYDNLGRRLIGAQRFGVNLADNSVLGIGDRDLTSVSFTKRSFGVVNHYELPLGAHGTKVAFDYAYSRLKLGEQFKALDVQGRATTFSPSISQELYAGKNLFVSSDLAFDFKDLSTDILGTKFSRDHLRILRPGFNIEEYDKTGRTSMRHEFGIGLNIFGASKGTEQVASRVGAGGKFFRYTASLTRTQKLPFSTYGVFRVMTQLSPDRLVSAEQFQAGGTFSVRGYKEGRVIGDSGFVASSEWRLPFFLFPKGWVVPGTSYSPHDNIQLITFADYGSIFVNHAAIGVDPNEFLLGTGVGVRARLSKYLVGRIDMGIPLLRQNPDSQRARIHFGLQSELF